MDMDVTAPASYQVVSNGRRIEETDLPGGMRRTVWRESVPIAPWLYVLGVATGMFLNYYYSHRQADDWRPILNRKRR